MTMTYKELVRRVRNTDLYRSAVGLESALSVPVPMVVRGEAYAGFLVLRTQQVAQGHTEIMKPEGAVVVRVADGQIARLENYLVLDPFPDIPWDKPVATFPHERIANWTRQRLEEEKERHFAALQTFAEHLATGDPDELRGDLVDMIRGFLTLTEPGLVPFLLLLSPSFARFCKMATKKGNLDSAAADRPKTKAPDVSRSPKKSPDSSPKPASAVMSAISSLAQKKS